jgi:hypothetical protein
MLEKLPFLIHHSLSLALVTAVFENRVLRRIFGSKTEEVTGGWRKSLNEKLHKLYFSPNISRMIKSRGIRWVGHVGCMGKMRNAYRILVRKPKRNNQLEDLGVNGRAMLRCFLEK